MSINNDRLKFRVYFTETISDKEDNEYQFNFYLYNISLCENGDIGIWIDDLKKQIKIYFDNLKNNNPKLTADDLEDFIANFHADNATETEEWLNITNTNFVYPIYIEQCTDSKDNELKKLIYESDIVKADIDFNLAGRINLIREVIFHQSAFCLKSSNGEILELNKYHNIRIIGNIHDNPELLEGKK